MYLSLNEEISFTWGDHSVVSGADAAANEADLVFGVFRLNASPYAEPTMVAEDRDIVSEAELIAHLAPTPARLSFLAGDGQGALPAGRTVTGAAFTETSFEPAFGGVVETRDMIMTFVDDRLGGYLSLARPSGIASSWFDENDAAEIVLADKTTIRLTGLIQGLSRKAAGGIDRFGVPGGYCAA